MGSTLSLRYSWCCRPPETGGGDEFWRTWNGLGEPKLTPKLPYDDEETGPPPPRLKMTKTKQLSSRTLCKMAMRFWKTTSSARTATRPDRATISRCDCSRCVSRAITVLCQIWSYWVRRERNSARTVLLRLSRKVSTRPACFFSILRRASCRNLDCSSMYCKERDVLDSSI